GEGDWAGETDQAGEDGSASPTGTRPAARTPTAAMSLDLVERCGVATAPWRLATSVDDVLRAGDAIGWPVVLKSNVDAGVLKARGGHVRLDVDRERAAPIAAAML